MLDRTLRRWRKYYGHMRLLSSEFMLADYQRSSLCPYLALSRLRCGYVMSGS
ncbi:MAG: hypothetical protein JWQ50_7914 [Caballeronia mineralivorans]|nr:hypothetical protein [Caballeronia mineralivorans]